MKRASLNVERQRQGAQQPASRSADAPQPEQRWAEVGLAAPVLSTVAEATTAPRSIRKRNPL